MSLSVLISIYIAHYRTVSVIQVSVLQACMCGTASHRTCNKTRTLRVFSINWKHFCLGVSQPQHIVTVKILHHRNTLIYLLTCSASSVLGAPSTAETDTSSVGDQSWRCWGLDCAECCSLSFRWSASAGRTKVLLFGDLGDRHAQLRQHSSAVKTLVHRHTDLVCDVVCHI